MEFTQPFNNCSQNVRDAGHALIKWQHTCSLFSESLYTQVTTASAESKLRGVPQSVALRLVLPGAAFSFSLSSFFSCRRATSAVRIPSLSFSRSCLSFRYRLASSSARVFPYLPYWLASEKGEQRSRVKCAEVVRRRQYFCPPLCHASGAKRPWQTFFFFSHWKRN